MSDSDDADIPDRDTCQKLVQQFAEITSTDEACAQFYLQDRQWNLERSVNAFFETQQTGGVSMLVDGDEPEIVINVDKAMVQALEAGQPSTEPPSQFSFITWNLDGLNDHNLKRRTKAVCKIIEMEKPDVVFFQEMIPETFSYMDTNLPAYMCIAGNAEGYFTATLIRRFTVYYDRHEIIQFSTSLMLRNILSVEAHIGPTKFQLLNCHLESTKDHTTERLRQLKTAFKKSLDTPETHTVILAGDLNLRDKELELTGGIPAGIEDLWITCGSRKECQYTWDCLRNSNTEMPGRFRPRMRFDRVYLRHSQPRSVIPLHFGLIGLQKVSNTQSFPSDHWGIQVHFSIEESQKKKPEKT